MEPRSFSIIMTIPSSSSTARMDDSDDGLQPVMVWIRRCPSHPQTTAETSLPPRIEGELVRWSEYAERIRKTNATIQAAPRKKRVTKHQARPPCRSKAIQPSLKEEFEDAWLMEYLTSGSNEACDVLGPSSVAASGEHFP